MTYRFLSLPTSLLQDPSRNFLYWFYFQRSGLGNWRTLDRSSFFSMSRTLAAFILHAQDRRFNERPFVHASTSVHIHPHPHSQRWELCRHDRVLWQFMHALLHKGISPKNSYDRNTYTTLNVAFVPYVRRTSSDGQLTTDIPLTTRKGLKVNLHDIYREHVVANRGMSKVFYQCEFHW